VIVGGALAAGGVGLLAKSLIGDNRARPAEYVLTRRDRVAAVLIGLFGGFIVGLTSVGTGVFFGLTMLIVFPLRSAKVVGTDVFHAAALLWVAGAAHLVAGNVDSRAVAALLAGSIPGVLIGSRQTLRLDERTLRASLAVVLLGSGVALAARPAPLAGPLVALCVAVPVAIALRRGRRALAVATPPIRQPAHATPSLPASRDLAVSARARAR
jgi:hypothetical protein